MDTVKLTLIGKQLIVTVNINGNIFGKVYPTRKEALEMYFTEAQNLEERGILDSTSTIEV